MWIARVSLTLTATHRQDRCSHASPEHALGVQSPDVHGVMDHVPMTSNGLIFSKINVSSKFNREEEKLMQMIQGTKKNVSLKKCLRVAEKKEQRLQELKGAGRHDKATELAQKADWSVALQRAEGAKVKDNLKLIKKTIKKVHKKKEKSAKLWQERKESIDRRQRARQARRQRNLKVRKQNKIERKIKSIRKRKGRA